MIHSNVYKSLKNLPKPLNTFAKKRAVKLRNLTKNNCLASSIEFWYGSFLEKDWTDGTIVFCHATCFSDR